jgi:hypothetical protein
MCIIARKVVTVSDTKILCAISGDRRRQLIVYSNKVENVTNDNMMILPVPNASTLLFHDLTNYTDLFNDCEKCFIEPASGFFSTNDFNFSKNFKYKSKPLNVFNVGSYQVSVANTLSDVTRADANVFQVSPSLNHFLTTHYSGSQWGFIFCKLQTGEGAHVYHPFGYSHDIFGDEVVVPTRHYHDHGVNTQPQWLRPTTTPGPALSYGFGGFGGGFGGNGGEEWSHDIYFHNIEPCKNQCVTEMNSNKKIWDKPKTFNKDKIPNFSFGTTENFSKVQIKGNHPNRDLFISVPPPSGGGGWFSFLGY